MSYRIIITEDAVADIAAYKKSDTQSFNKVQAFLAELKDHPKTGTGQPERLKYKKGEIWSRRINKKDRLVYEVEDETVTVTVLSASDHYSDK